jgi:hypothetical protein
MSKKITFTKAARLVDAMEALRECEDFPPELARPFEDVRAAVSPWYDV